MLVFIDEAGDPGFKLERGSSSIFVIALIIFHDTLEAEKTSLAIKQLRRDLKLTDQYEFKFNSTSKAFRNKFIDAVKNFNFQVRAIIVNKKVIESTRLRSYKEDFYNYFVMQVLKNNGGKIRNAKLKFDSRGEKVLRNQLRVYLSAQLGNSKVNIFSDVKFVDSKQNTLISSPT